jgi:hypothetical protein
MASHGTGYPPILGHHLLTEFRGSKGLVSMLAVGNIFCLG